MQHWATRLFQRVLWIHASLQHWYNSFWVLAFYSTRPRPYVDRGQILPTIQLNLTVVGIVSKLVVLQALYAPIS